MAVKNLFSQITDSRFYSGTAWHTWNVTDNISITNSSQSYTTEVSYSGPVDVTSTRYGAGGIEYYTYSTTTDGMVKASVHPYEYTTTTSLSITNVVKNTSETNSYRVAVENSMSFSYSESNYFYYEEGRVGANVYQDVTLVSNMEKAPSVTASIWEDVSVYNKYGADFTSMNNYKTIKIDSSNLVSNTIRLHLYDGSGPMLPGPETWYKSYTFYAAITYKSYGNETTSMVFSDVKIYLMTHKQELAFAYTDTGSYSVNYPYLTYYSKSTSWNTLTTVELTYIVPAQTTTSWVSPKQLSSLVSQ